MHMVRNTSKKTILLFVDRKNNLSSQLAEYYTKQLFPDKYEVYSAGVVKDIVDCDLLSVMYCQGDDLRNQVSKDFFDEEHLPKGEPYNYVIYTEKDVFEEYAHKSPWQGRQIVAHMGSMEEFTSTDDFELAQEINAMAARARTWVSENLDDPEKLKSLVSK